MGQLTQLVEHVVYLLGSIGRRGGYLTGVDDYLLGIQMNAAQQADYSRYDPKPSHGFCL
jgi:hypothetical protein